MTVSIKEKYNKEVVSGMMKKFNFKNRMEVPRIQKLVVNVGIGKFLKDKNQVEDIVESVRVITGQKPLMTKSRLSISGFKIREGMEVGIKVTLRGTRMWNFLEKLVNVTIPRIKDFQGIKESVVDDKGNMNFGIKDHIIFPEIVPEQVKNSFSLQVNITSTAKNKEEGLELFKLIGFPIKSN